MKNQTMVVGIFVILIGILIMVYWILLPVSEKEKLLNEIYGNVSNKTTVNTSYSSYSSTLGLMLRNIYLYSDKKEIIIADNYSLGTLVPFNEIQFGDIGVETSMFSGKKSKNINFYYSEGDAILLSFVSKCSDGYIEIKINGHTIYSGCPAGLQRVLIQKEYLKQGNNLLTIEFYPNSIFSKSSFSLSNFKIIYLKRSEINYDLYYQGENVYISYDFCPTDPNSLRFYINDREVSLYSCQNNYLDIIPFLNMGLNKLRLVSDVETKINLKVVMRNNVFIHTFNLTVREPVKLIVVKDEGSANLYINSCMFNLEPYKTSYTFVLNSSCIYNGENVLIIRPNSLVKIYTLSII